MSTQSSANVKQLITKPRIVSFSAWNDTYPQEIIQMFEIADDEARYLSNEDLQQLSTFLENKFWLLTPI
jgi:hypothetical protein